MLSPCSAATTDLMHMFATINVLESDECASQGERRVLLFIYFPVLRRPQESVLGLKA